MTYFTVTIRISVQMRSDRRPRISASVTPPSRPAILTASRKA
jgi:hypothetical protein